MLLLNLSILFVMFKLIFQIIVLNCFAFMKFILLILYGYNPIICLGHWFWSLVNSMSYFPDFYLLDY